MSSDSTTYTDAGDEALRFECPRCAVTVRERFWGPCGSCRTQLATSVAGEAHEMETSRFEPAMHVVPNQVATKE